MEIDHCQLGSLTIVFSYISKFIITLEHDGKIIETTNHHLLKLLSKSANIMEVDGHVLELQPSKRGPIIRLISFKPRYKRTAIQIHKDQMTPLINYLNETLFIQKEIKIVKKNSN